MKEKKLTYPEIPEGLAPFYVYGPTQTACLLCKARGPHSNKLPDSLDHLEIVSAGIAFMKEGDEYKSELGEIISLGRSIKAHKKRNTPMTIYDSTMMSYVGVKLG